MINVFQMYINCILIKYNFLVYDHNSSTSNGQ